MTFIQRWTTVLRPPVVAEKARRQNSIPPYMARDVASTSSIFTWEQFWESKSEEEKQRIALSVSWIYSAIDLIASECAATGFHVKDVRPNEKEIDVPNHEFEKKLKTPNEFMTKTFLLRYTIYWLEMSRLGAFWYLAPDKNTGELAEIWPINPNQMTVVPSTTQFVDHFIYKPQNTSERGYKINPKYVAWFRYPDPFDYWASLPPLLAALLPAEIELGIQNSQNKFYSESRGIPLSLVSLDPDLGEADFESARADIKEDWSSGATIAIARAGDIDVKSLGFTQRDLEILGNQNITRDKIDSIFFGYPIRSDTAFDGDGIKEADRLVKEKKIFPLLTGLGEEITKSVIQKFYETKYIGMFDDVRTADRALNIQEDSLNSRWRTVNEMRAKDGLPPMADPELPNIGELLVWLATNPSFVATKYGLNARVDGGNIETPPDVGNLTDSEAPESFTNRLVNSQAEKVAVLTELKRWKTVAKRALKSGEPRDFISVVIPEILRDEIETGLLTAGSDTAIDTLFTEKRELIEAVEF
jgi:phage portal protein BeeE